MFFIFYNVIDDTVIFFIFYSDNTVIFFFLFIGIIFVRDEQIHGVYYI